MTRQFAAGTCAHVMVHEVVGEFAASVGEAIGKFRSRGIQKDARGLQSGSANEKDARFELESAFGLRVDDANTADAPSLRIEDETVNDAVGTNGEAAGFFRGGESRSQAAGRGVGGEHTASYAAR